MFTVPMLRRVSCPAACHSNEVVCFRPLPGLLPAVSWAPLKPARLLNPQAFLAAACAVGVLQILGALARLGGIWALWSWPLSVPTAFSFSSTSQTLSLFWWGCASFLATVNTTFCLMARHGSSRELMVVGWALLGMHRFATPSSFLQLSAALTLPAGGSHGSCRCCAC